MDILLGLAASISYGATDFLGGLGARRTPALAIVFLSQAIGLAVLLVAIPVFGSAPLTGHTVLWGSVGGVVGSFGLVFLYRGLSRGPMSMVAPVGAVLGAAVPVVVDFVAGHSVGGLGLAGVGLALVSLVLVSSGSGRGGDGRPSTPRSGVPALFDAVLAGLGVAGFLIFFARAGEASGLWPLAVARGASFVALGVVAIVQQPIRRAILSPTWLVLPIALLDTTANLFYLLATRAGLLAIAAVLTSLYPVTTVLLARAVLKERVAKIQALGLALAVAGVALIALS